MNEIDITYIWLLVGVIFLLVETIGFPGVGLMFAGLGAITTGAALYFGFILESSSQEQFILFFVSTAAWAALLWKPLQKFIANKSQKEYSNIIGDSAYVGSAGLSRSNGEVSWSGTIMKAKLADDAGVDTLEAGSEVEITEVSGTVLTVKPKT